MSKSPIEKTTEFVWLDGEIVPWAQAVVPMMTNTLHYGTGVFEGIRCYKTDEGPSIFRFHDHMVRLYNSAKVVGFEAPWPIEQTSAVTKELIVRNKLEECYIRPLIFLGSECYGVNWIGNSIRFAIVVYPWGTYLGEGALEKGVRVKVSSFTRHHVNVNMTKAKVCGNYVNSQLAKVEAVRDGYDEALMPDKDGFIVEGSGENLFILERGNLVTPPLGSILPGITRETIITLAEEMGLEVKEDRITRDRIYCAEEFFFTGTAAEITPIREVDRRKIGDGKPGKITKRLQEKFFAAVRGKDKSHPEWREIVKMTPRASETTSSPLSAGAS